jgi:hypothetical protein
MSVEMSPSQGLDFILSHVPGSLFPRWIVADKKGKLVHNKEEVLAMFAKAKFKDCMLNGYPPYDRA